ncbi:MAG: hypothetical protein NZM11_07840 [Anaerolineales bacterium]|nr:hypothetical protein [Anaerolineales bacterium]
MGTLLRAHKQLAFSAWAGVFVAATLITCFRCKKRGEDFTRSVYELFMVRCRQHLPKEGRERRFRNFREAVDELGGLHRPRPRPPRKSPKRVMNNPIHGGSGSTPTEIRGAGGTAPSRRHPAHPPVIEALNRSIIVFLTVCTKDRQPILANPFMHDLLIHAWSIADHWLVGRYVIMPDHIHLFCAPATWPTMPLKNWVTYWKSLVARALRGHGPLAGGSGSTPTDYDGAGGTAPSITGAGGTAPSITGAGGTAPSRPRELWQRDYWDTQLRRGESYSAKWEYVRRNTVRAGLVSDIADWPYQGELNILDWHS